MLCLRAQKKIVQCNGLPSKKVLPDDGPYVAETCCKLKMNVKVNDILKLIRIIVVRHTSYNEDDLEVPSSAINK
jgi:hypothetical protein